MPQTVKIQKQNTRLIAHRGASGLERENTCAAFVAAGNRSYFGIETDIHKTLDGKFVVYHDDTTQRLTEVDWEVEACTLEQLHTLRLKDLDDKIRNDLIMPTLQEYLRICKKYEKIAVLELKNSVPFQPEDIRTITEIVREEGWLEHMVFISFQLDNLRCLRELLPEQPLQYLARTLSQQDLDHLAAYRLDADVKYTGLTKEVVDRVHALGRTVNTWTVNDPETAENLIQMGVDFITTNILE
jgi:glycerophosphoryl diester phosphodiesterase